jgi:hypothetical protein
VFPVYLQVFDFFGFLDSLRGLLIAIYNALITAIIYLINLLVAVFVFLYNLLILLLNATVRAFQHVGHFFTSLLDRILRHVLVPLLHLYQRLSAWLNKVLTPVIKILRRIRAWYDKFFKVYVKPVLDAINHIRKVLAVFKIFHIKWAAKLDADLADIEHRIIRDFELVRRQINKVLSWIELIMDPEGLLLRLPLARSIVRALDDILQLTTGHVLSYYLSSPTGIGGGGPAVYGPAQAAKDVRDAGAGVENYLTEAQSNAVEFIGDLMA